MLRKFLKTKKRGNVAITLEVLISVVLFCFLCTFTMHIVKVQKNQKLMFDTFISTATQCSKWGGNNSSVAAANGKKNPIDAQMLAAVNTVCTTHPVSTLKATPNAVSAGNKNIHLVMEFTDEGYTSGLFSNFGTYPHKIEGTFRSVVKPGILVKPYTGG